MPVISVISVYLAPLHNRQTAARRPFNAVPGQQPGQSRGVSPRPVFFHQSRICGGVSLSHFLRVAGWHFKRAAISFLFAPFDIAKRAANRIYRLYLSPRRHLAPGFTCSGRRVCFQLIKPPFFESKPPIFRGVCSISGGLSCRLSKCLFWPNRQGWGK